jgi:hypothetical protein
VISGKQLTAGFGSAQPARLVRDCTLSEVEGYNLCWKSPDPTFSLNRQHEEIVRPSEDGVWVGFRDRIASLGILCLTVSSTLPSSLKLESRIRDYTMNMPIDRVDEPMEPMEPMTINVIPAEAEAETEEKVSVEEFTINGDALVAKVKELVHEGNIRRIIPLLSLSPE